MKACTETLIMESDKPHTLGIRTQLGPIAKGFSLGVAKTQNLLADKAPKGGLSEVKNVSVKAFASKLD